VFATVEIVVGGGYTHRPHVAERIVVQKVAETIMAEVFTSGLPEVAIDAQSRAHEGGN
jgi:hypothetical protein